MPSALGLVFYELIISGDNVETIIGGENIKLKIGITIVSLGITTFNPNLLGSSMHGPRLMRKSRIILQFYEVTMHYVKVAMGKWT